MKASREFRRKARNIFIVGLILGFIIGFMVAGYMALEFALKMAQHFLHISFNQEAMSRLINMYPELQQMINGI